MIAVSSGAEYFEVKDKVRGDIGAFKVVESEFEVENLRGYPWEGLVQNELLVLVMSGA